jgi:hypothetical protein
MESGKKNRTKWLHLRLTDPEYRQIKNKFDKTTCRKMSDYVRAVIFGHAVITTYRNASIDGMMAEMAVLNKELNAIGNNINQMAKKMHTIQLSEMQQWILHFDGQAGALMAKMDQVRDLLEKLAGQWLR